MSPAFLNIVGAEWAGSAPDPDTQGSREGLLALEAPPQRLGSLRPAWVLGTGLQGPHGGRQLPVAGTATAE